MVCRFYRSAKGVTNEVEATVAVATALFSEWLQ
jgi:hypothetical protein